MEKLSSDAATLRLAADGEQEQLRLVTDHAAESEADDVGTMTRERQPDPGHGQQTRALRCGPGFAESGIEAVAHDVHHRVEVEQPAFRHVEIFAGHDIGLASAPRP